MLRPYPVHFDAIRPERFSRSQVFLRIAATVLLLFLGVSLRWLGGFLYLAIPIGAAALLAQGDGTGNPVGRLSRMTPGLRAVVGFLAWLAFLTDRFPSTDETEHLRFEIAPQGNPTVGSALLRLFTSIPVAFFAALLWFVAGLIGFVAALFVLVQERFPPALYDVQRGIVRLIARALAYHSSIVDTYPPFAFEMGPDEEQMQAA